MTLAKRMTLKIVVLSAMLLLLVGSATWGLLAARQSVRIARDEYHELHMVLTLDEHLSSAKIVIATDSDPVRARTAIAATMSDLQAIQGFQRTQRGDIHRHEYEEQGLLAAMEEDLTTLSSLMEIDSDKRNAGRLLAAIDRVKEGVNHLAVETDEAIAAAQMESKQALQRTLAALAFISLATIATMAAVGITQYRSVVMPLRRLRDGARKIASGQLKERLEVTDTEEYAQLAGDFNQMATELRDLYDDLERQVSEKSRVLARSERLASVGFLAAGVAHEINNPLNIISGYAELTLRRLHKQTDASEPVDVEEALRIMRDESFRCKNIIQKLLSLSAGDVGNRERVALDRITDEVASIVGMLTQYRDRSVSVHCDRAPQLDVFGNDTELKQVVLHLTLNALDAVEPDVGEVRIEGRQRNGKIELVVSDNGKGLTTEARDRVFEPFYTQKMGSSGRGLGLGLSITHAIIESHGGRITVTSDGPNKGSRFLVELPCYTKDMEEA